MPDLMRMESIFVWEQLFYIFFWNEAAEMLSRNVML